MRGTGEGHYPMGAANTTMTNGNVTTMTNGSVSAPAVRSGKIGQLSVEYKGGHSEITVDADVPVTQLSRGNPSLLAAGRAGHGFHPSRNRRRSHRHQRDRHAGGPEISPALAGPNKELSSR